MVEVLSFRHAGVRCALPLGQVLLVHREGDVPHTLCLWDEVAAPESHESRRVVQLLTPSGPAELYASDPLLAEIEASRVFELPELLRDWMPLLYVVGVADLQDQLVWLVDARRLAPALRPDTARTAALQEEGDAA